MANRIAAVARAAAKAASASRERDDAIRAAVREGHSLRQVAMVCELSHQRVHQIVRGEPAPTR